MSIRPPFLPCAVFLIPVMCRLMSLHLCGVRDRVYQLGTPRFFVELMDGGWRRFDLIYLVLDKAEEATDRKLARHLLSLHYERGQNAAQVRSTF